MNDDRMICHCAEVTEGDIRAALAKGAKNINDVKRMTGACTMGRCLKMKPEQTCCGPEILKIIDAYNESLMLNVITNNQPNAETIEAIEEVQEMKKNPNLAKSYDDVDIMMEEL